MAGAHVTVEIDDARLQRNLADLELRARALQPVYKDIGEHLRLSHRDRFDRQVTPDDEAWAPLSARTRARKPRRKDRILELDGHLRDTLAYRATHEELRFGTNRIYGAVHQFGASAGAFGTTPAGLPIPFGDIPARPFLGVSAEDRVQIDRIVGNHLTEPFRR